MTDAVRTTTFAELRSRAAFKLDDLVQVSATNDGTTTTLRDVLNIPTGNEDLVRRQIVFTSVDYQGVQGLITNTDQSSHTITFTPDLSGITNGGVTTADIFNKRGMGFTLNEYLKAAIMTQDDGFPLHRLLIESTATAFSSATPTYSIPATIDEVHEVLYQDPDGDWFPIQKAPATGRYGWQVNKYDNQIVINGPVRYSIDGFDMKVIGYGREAPITGDTSTTQLHPRWFVATMCYHLCLLGLNRDATGMRAKQVMTFQQEAREFERLIATRRGSMSTSGRNS